MDINSTMKILYRHTRVFTFLLTLLLLGSVTNEAWAYNITYHVLTLPFTTYQDDGTTPNVSDIRTEAIRVYVTNGSTVELPDQFKSPLATDYSYYASTDITKSGTAQAIYKNNATKYYTYTIKDGATPLTPSSSISGDCDIYVTYSYNNTTSPIDLSGGTSYNISIGDGFLAFNRGRNNRVAVVPKDHVSAEQLVSEDFVYVNVSNVANLKDKTYWKSGDNKNPEAEVKSQFHFLFKYEGNDPYNIIIRSAYNKDTHYIEKWASDIGFVNKYYKGARIFSKSTDEILIASDDNKKYTTVYTTSTTTVDSTPMGDYFRKLDAPVWNSFALLNAKDNSEKYVFMASKNVKSNGDFDVPSNNQQYYFLQNNYAVVKFVAMTVETAANKYATDDEMYEPEDVYFKIVTQFGSNVTASIKRSRYTIEHDEIKVEDIPSELNRKYCNLTGRFYKDAALTQEITKYSEAEGNNIYVGYEVSNTIPFKAIKPSDSYTTATWYELTDFESEQSSGKKIKWDGNSAFKNNGGKEVYEKESEFAFVGDPYELRVLYRDATKTAGANRYISAATVSDGTALGFSDTAGDGYKWEIPFGENSDRFVLRLFGSSASTPMYWKWDATSAGSTVVLDDDAAPTRIKVMELPERNFTFKIVDKAGNIAVTSTVSHTIFSPLNGFASIPEVIRSPFLSDETVTFYDTYSGGGRGNLDNLIDEAPNTNHDIFVKYTTSHLNNKSIHLNADELNQQFNVKLNGSYIYYDGGVIKSNASPSTDELATDPYVWFLRGRDPYAMLIDNKAARTSSSTESVTIYNDDGVTSTDDKAIGGWIRVDNGTWGDNKALGFTSTRTEASRFIAIMGNNIGVYEVMAATGDDTFFHIGRTTDTKVYSINTSGYAHGDDALRFELAGKDAITYHLIDKAGNDLFENEIISNNPRLALPADYVSPLVAEYYYYPTLAKAGTDKAEDRITEIENDTNESGEGGENKDFDVYVTYKVNDRVKFNDDSSPYLLKFLNGSSYKMENGNDKLTSEAIKAMYPYTNGDGNLNIYGERMNEEQMNGGSSTRPRWVWFFDSEHDDPYHVKIHSKSTINHGGIGHPTYLQTYAVHFNQSAENVKTVVTGGILAGIASTPPTEYMILGTAGRFKLRTTATIDDGITNERRNVTSFEQYWKTYNMIKLEVLGIDKSTNAFSNDESTWTVPTDKRAELNTKLEALGIGSGNWHSYDAIANAVRWNGFNDKSDGEGKKVVEKLEHWYQTFEMGDGTFDIESADIPPVLILLDRHGWEIMRKPLPKYEAYPYGDELADLKVYDSPMVKEYKFYNNATKATGCHKYTLRLDDKTKAERDQIKVSGKHFTSASLAILPPRTASGVISGGVVSDLYVTYTVKEEYEKSYTYNFTDNGNGTYTESGTPSKFMILQNGRFARENPSGSASNYLSKPIGEAGDPIGGNIFEAILSPNTETASDVSTQVDANKDGVIDDINMWYVQPNLNIDKEMGIVWGTSDDITSAEPLSEYGTKKKYKDITGFDPYNIQLKNADVSNGRNLFMTSHMTTTALSSGAMVGDYTGGDNTITLENWVDVKNADTTTPKKNGDITVDEGYDHTNLQVTNQTFMAVSDALGNMQLMPRFDHSKRMNVTTSGSSRTTLEDAVDHTQKASADDNESMGPQTVLLVRPQLFEYHIIDNDGNEALRYKTAGEYFPSIPEHFKSPLATEFKYYKTAPTYDSGTKTLTVSDEITGSFAAAGLNDMISQVYVRYSYDASADELGILQGQWFTINLAGKDVKANGTIDPADGTGVSLVSGSKPSTTPTDELKNAHEWHWKLLAAPADPSSAYYVAPDPYAIQIFNRYSNYATTLEEPSPMSVGIKVNNKNRFSLLSHPDGGYALAVNGLGTYSYDFVNGETEAAATTATEKNYQLVVANNTAYETAKTALAGQPNGDYYFKINNNKTYKKVTVSGGNPDEGAESTKEAWERAYHFTIISGSLSSGSRLIVNDDVTHDYTYHVINNASKLAVSHTQDNAEAAENGFTPTLPYNIQTPLLNMNDYLYYGSVNIEGDNYTVVDNTKLFTLYGLYDDVVYVRYNAYNMDNTEYMVPNKRNATGSSTIAVADDAKYTALNISGGLPYNIIWEDDKMMKTDGSTIANGGSHALDGATENVWRFFGGDPYAIQIRHGNTGNYAIGSATLNETPDKTFMLLKHENYPYGVLQVTGTTGDDAGKKLTGFGGELTADANTAPKYFIIFGLSTHKLIYHLVINTTNVNTTIPYREGTEDSPGTLTTKNIPGTTQRDLSETYQLGSTIMGQTYCVDAGEVSIGDVLKVPTEFNRPNCKYFFYIDNIQKSGAKETYQKTATSVEDMNTQISSLPTSGYYYFKIGDGDSYKRVTKSAAEPSTVDCTVDDWNNVWQDEDEDNGLNKYKGLEITKLMSDANLIGSLVKVNVAYAFETGLETNAGEGFVTSLDQNLWYTFETPDGSTPYLAHYTNAWGLQSMAGRDTRYTNDYLWTPLGDVYGFKMYNRYMIKNSSGGSNKVMTMTSIGDNVKLKMEVPGEGGCTSGYEVFELLGSNTPGHFRIHPVVNHTGTQYYIKRHDANTDIDGDRQPDPNYAILSTSYSEWTFGLNSTLLAPYVERVGYVGGLTETAYTAQKDLLDKVKNGTADYEELRTAQGIVYADANAVPYTPGYYRMHNQPGVSGINPVRYASGYTHKTELTGDGVNTAGPIPMHFYSKAGVSTTFGSSGLKNGYTSTDATRGDIPIVPTEQDPSTIFYFDGNTVAAGTIPTSKISTQGLYVKGKKTDDDDDHGDAVMTASASDATTFSLIDIGGAVLLITDKVDPASRNYLHFDQDYTVNEDNKIYNLKFFHNSPTDDAKWCLQPVQKSEAAGTNEMPLQIRTNNGGDDYYYATFYAPFDVALPADADDKTYNAFICETWNDKGLHPIKVPAKDTYTAGKYIPAGTPVLIRTSDESGSVTLMLPSTSTSDAPTNNIFKGSYLEMLLDADANHDVFTLGVPFVSEVTSFNRNNGEITAPLPEQANSGVGFYINATPNKENDALQSMWLRNNRYVLHNKIYYRATGGSPARGVEFVPVVFKSETTEIDGVREYRADTPYPGGVYNLQGRCVATEEQVLDGTWRQHLAPGIYIMNGRSIIVK